MATKFICHALLRQRKCIQISHGVLHSSSIKRPSWYYAERNGLSTVTSTSDITNRFLHVKVYDKDAGLEEQRALNKYPNEKEEEGDFNAPPSSKKIGKGRRLKSPTNNNINNGLQIRNKEEVVEEEDAVLKEDDADTFGNSKINEGDEGDLIEEEYNRNPTRRTKKLCTKEYANMIKTHLKEHRLKEAIEVLEKRMLKEDRVKPENYIYNLLISGCAKAGYTRKAFSLFTRMRQRGLKVKESTYTSLFNACANAPQPIDGLSRANHLREIMLEKGVEPNVINYNAMIKAYGRCGDVKTAYLLADEMMERNLNVNAETFNFLLQACASDSEFGFRHCLLTWHKMLQRQIKPDYYSFKTVLLCTRDCDFGDLQTMQEVLGQILEERRPMQITNEGSEKQNILMIGESCAQSQTANTSALEITQPINEGLSVESSEENVANNKSSTVSTNLEIPNLLAPQAHLGSLVSLSEVRFPYERFLLLGGINGFLDLMKKYNITPDIQMFTTMLEVIPPTYAVEKQLLSFIRKIGLKSDIDFFNILIKKRSMRFDYEGAKEVVSMIRTAGLHPDIVTYGVLALGCQTAETARELLEEMRNNGVRMNTQILGAMLRQGCAHQAFPYVVEILQISLDENVKPNAIFLTHLHNFYNRCARAIDARHPSTKKKMYKKQHAKFCDKLRLYYEELGIAGLKLEDAIRKIKERPYEHYKEASVDGIEPIKNEKLARKQKLRKYIKKIKIENLKGDNGEVTNISQSQQQKKLIE